MEGFTELSRIREFKGKVPAKAYIGLWVSELRQSHGLMQSYIRIVESDQSILTQEISIPVSSMKTINDFLGMLTRLVNHDIELIQELVDYSEKLDQM